MTPQTEQPSNGVYEVWQVIYQYYDTAGNLIIVQGKQGGGTADVQQITIPTLNQINAKYRP